MAKRSTSAHNGASLFAASEAASAFRAADKDGLAWGLELHRWVEPKDWPRALEERVPAEHRAVAEEYLRGIAQRMRNLRALQRHGPDGPPGN